jgi:hypothetical protein
MEELIETNEIKQLAKYFNVNLENLEISNLVEMGEVYYAHEKTGDEQKEIMSFFSRAKKPSLLTLTPQFILKAVKFNPEFCKMYSTVIMMCQEFRQEVYDAKANDNVESEKQSTEAKKVKSEEQPDGTKMVTYIIVLKPQIPDKYLSATAASADGRYKLPACYNVGSELDYEVKWTQVSPTNGNPDYENIEILLTPLKTKDLREFLANRKFFVKIFSNKGTVYSIGPVHPEPKDESYVKFCCNIRKGCLSGCAWNISYTEDF